MNSYEIELWHSLPPPPAAPFAPAMAMTRFSTLNASADASMLGVTAFNVGMNSLNSHSRTQDEKVAILAGLVTGWLSLEGQPSVVGLNEIAPNIFAKLQDVLQERGVAVNVATYDTNAVLWLS